MAAYTNNDGTQTITFDYKQNATSSSFNVLLRNLMKAGVYEGGLLSVFDIATVTIDPFIVVVDNKYDGTLANQLAIRVETETSFNLAITEATPVVVLRYEWLNVDVNYVQPLVVALGAELATDVVLGVGTFTTGSLTGIDYNNATSPREAISKDADTILLGGVSIDSQPTGGTNSIFLGSSTYITDILTDIYARLIDLSGVGNLSIKLRHMDLDIATGTDGNDLKTGNTLNYSGSAPSTITDITSITTAIQTVIDLITDLTGANDDSVHRRHIDFGTGVSQVSLKDFIIGIVGSQTMDGGFTSYSYGATAAINTALNDLASIVNEIATQVNLNTSKAGTDLENRVVALEAKQTVDDMPIGTILMYSGTAWSAGSLGGHWQVCDGQVPTPNLVGRFIKGATSLDPISTNNEGGATGVVLADNNMPDHFHTNSLAITGTALESGKHRHKHNLTGNQNATRYTSLSHSGGYNSGYSFVGTTGVPIINDYDTNGNSKHTHVLSGTASGNSSTVGEVVPTAVVVDPLNYAMIFIMKVS